MLEVAEEKIADVRRVERPRRGRTGHGLARVHPAAEGLRNVAHRGRVGGRAGRERGPRGDGGEQGRAFRGARLDREAVVDLGDGEVEARPGGGAALHRVAEAGGRGPAAVDGHDEQPPAAGAVGGVGDVGAEEHGILDRQGREVAAADAEHGKRRGVGHEWLLVPAVAVADERRDRLPGGKEEVLERVGPDDVVEAARRLVTPQAVAAAVLVVEPAGGQVGDTRHVVEHDGAGGDAWADDAVACGDQSVDDGLEVGLREPVRRADGGGAGHRDVALAEMRGVLADRNHSRRAPGGASSA